jgi:hypothetical protein
VIWGEGPEELRADEFAAVLSERSALVASGAFEASKIRLRRRSDCFQTSFAGQVVHGAFSGREGDNVGEVSE